jgi:cytochrome c biogenesis protein CcmG/thiol:disulfide interchange protein DsbE
VKHRTDWLLLGAIATLAVALVYVVSGTLDQHVVNAGETAPDFSITTNHGRTVTRDNFGGKLLVLNFWATWCSTCIVEMPSLDAFQREFGPKGVVVLGVSVDRNPKLYQQYLERTRPSFETALDPDANISASYGTFQYPETYIIDRSGKVIEKVISNQNWMDPDFLARMRRML